MRQLNISKRLSRSLLLAVVCFGAYGPTLGERLPIKIYTSADGLGSSASFNLARDQRGFIWLCSRDGLVRFDGYRFNTYRVGDESADPAVFNILPDRSGRYWINLNRGTDYRLVPRSDSELVSPISNEQIAGDCRIVTGNFNFGALRGDSDPRPEPGFFGRVERTRRRVFCGGRRQTSRFRLLIRCRSR